MKEKCHESDEESTSYYSCRLPKGHSGKHKWWTSLGNASSHEWDNE